MKTVFALAAIAVSGSVASAAVVTQWNFNSVINDGLTSTGTTLPFVGSGTASLVGGVTSPSFNAGGTTGIAQAAATPPRLTTAAGRPPTIPPKALATRLPACSSPSIRPTTKTSSSPSMFATATPPRAFSVSSTPSTAPHSSMPTSMSSPQPRPRAIAGTTAAPTSRPSRVSTTTPTSPSAS